MTTTSWRRRRRRPLHDLVPRIGRLRPRLLGILPFGTVAGADHRDCVSLGQPGRIHLGGVLPTPGAPSPAASSLSSTSRAAAAKQRTGRGARREKKFLRLPPPALASTRTSSAQSHSRR